MPGVILLFGSLVKKLIGLKLLKEAGRQFIIDSLLDVVTGESQRIGELDVKVQALVDEAFRSGLDHLKISSRQSGVRRVEGLLKARDAFLRAKNVYAQIHPLNSSRAAVYVGACSELLDEPSYSLLSYEEAFNMLSTMEMKLVTEGPFSFSGAITEAAFVLTCPLYRIGTYSRRDVLASTKATLEGFIGRNNVAMNRLKELYPIMVPICELLHSRKSRLPNLPQPQDLSIQNLPERAVQHLEKRCNIQLKN